MRRVSNSKSLSHKGFGVKKESQNFDHSYVESQSVNQYINKQNWANSPSICENLIDKEMLAKFLDVSQSFISKMMTEEGLPYFKIGRAVRFRLKEVMEFLERRRKP